MSYETFGFAFHQKFVMILVNILSVLLWFTVSYTPHTPPHPPHPAHTHPHTDTHMCIYVVYTNGFGTYVEHASLC